MFQSPTSSIASFPDTPVCSAYKSEYSCNGLVFHPGGNIHILEISKVALLINITWKGAVSPLSLPINVGRRLELVGGLAWTMYL